MHTYEKIFIAVVIKKVIKDKGNIEAFYSMSFCVFMDRFDEVLLIGMDLFMKQDHQFDRILIADCDWEFEPAEEGVHVL